MCVLEQKYHDIKVVFVSIYDVYIGMSSTLIMVIKEPRVNYYYWLSLKGAP